MGMVRDHVHMEKPRRDHRDIDPRVEIGVVHLNVGDLDRSLAFYEGVLGFRITQRIGQSAVFLGAGEGRRQIALSVETPEVPPDAGTRAARFSIRYPDRELLADALRRVTAAAIPLEGARDQGIGEALYLRDPDGHGVELYYERPREKWPRESDGTVRAVSVPLDLKSLEAAAANIRPSQPAGAADRLALADATRTRLRDMRVRLLNLHKVLLEDTKAAYEMDRGRIGSNASLLQLVINDPWFAWLHPLSELVVRIDETLQPDAPATEADGAMLLEQVERLLSPAQGIDAFAQRYYDALQRQPAVIVAHAEVRRLLKQAK
jgi:catechol 2,3-dioxygenase